MAKYRKLDNPPIVEAIVDFRVRRHNGVSADDLLSRQDSLVELGFPHRKEQRIVEVKLSADGEQQDRTTGFSGYRFVSEDEKRLVHFQLEGFAFNLVGNYDTWESMISEALKLWGIYQDAANPVSIVRIGTRFINRLSQAEETPPREILINPPTVPGVSDDLYRGSQETVLIEQPNGIRVRFLQAVNYSGGPYNVIIDTDSFYTLEGGKELDLPCSSDKLMSFLDPLRDSKNELFFESVTEKALTVYVDHAS